MKILVLPPQSEYSRTEVHKQLQYKKMAQEIKETLKKEE